MLQPLPIDLWSLSLFPFQLASRGNKGRAGRPWVALQMLSELVILALLLIQGSLGAAHSLQRGAQLCPPGSKSLSAASSTNPHVISTALGSPRTSGGAAPYRDAPLYHPWGDSSSHWLPDQLSVTGTFEQLRPRGDFSNWEDWVAKCVAN